MKQEHLKSKMLSNYNEKDFKQWKEDGFTKTFFDFLSDKASDIEKLVMADFASWTQMSPEKLKIYENRQAFYRCLLEILDVDFQSIVEYYKCLEQQNDEL